MQLADQHPFSWFYFLREETGASLMEYALIALLAVIVCTLSLLALEKGR